MEEALPPDGSLVQGVLPNGVRFALQTHAAPPGQAVMRLLVGAGSLHEAAGKRGSAFTLTRLLHAAAGRTKAAEAILSLGKALPPDSRPLEARTELDSMSFTVMLPLADEAALGLGLRHLGNIASAGELTPTLLLELRPQLLKDRLARLDTSERIAQAVVSRIYPSSRIALHPVVPSEDALCALSYRDLLDFHSKHLVSSNLTVLIVADAPTEALARLVRVEFGRLPRGEAPERLELTEDLSPTLAVGVTDQELVQGVAEIIRIDQGGASLTSVEGFKRQVRSRLAARALERRLRSAMDNDGAAILGATVIDTPAAAGTRVSIAAAKGDGPAWRSLVSELAGQIQMVRLAGFTEEELNAAVDDLLRERLEEADRLKFAPGAEILGRISEALSRGDTPLSPAQSAALWERSVSGVTAAELRDAVEERFDPSRTSLVVLLPGSMPAPEAESIIEAAEQGIAAARSEQVRAPGAQTILDKLPTAGTVDELAVNPRLGVSSAWLTNGVRVHHRVMNRGSGSVVVSVTLFGGEIEEDERSSGLTEASSALWAAPATRTRSAAELRALAAEAGVNLSSTIEPEFVSLELSAPAGGLQSALELLHGLLTEPLIDGAAFERWRWSSLRRMEAAEVQPLAFANHALTSALVSKPAAGTEAELRGMTLEGAQGWIEPFIRRAPIEVSIVGDADRAEALRLAERYLGSLGPRARVSSTTLCDLRPTPREPRLTVAEIELKTPTPHALVLVAFPGARSPEARSTAALDIAARVLSLRMASLRDEPGKLAWAVEVEHLEPAQAWGARLICTTALTSDSSAGRIADLIERVHDTLAQTGPNEEEMIIARAQIVEQYEELLENPAVWARALAVSTYRGEQAFEFVRAAELAEVVSSTEIRDTMRSHDPPSCCRTHRLRLIIRPAADR